MSSHLGVLLAMGAMLGAACPPMGRGFQRDIYRPRCRMPTHVRRANPNKKRRRKARQKAQRRNR